MCLMNVIVVAKAVPFQNVIDMRLKLTFGWGERWMKKMDMRQKVGLDFFFFFLARAPSDLDLKGGGGGIFAIDKSAL